MSLTLGPEVTSMLAWWQSLDPELHAYVEGALRVVLILVAALALWSAIGGVLRGLGARLGGTPEGAARARTLSRVARHVAGVALGGMTVTLILGEVGVSLSPILATAGVAGVAIGFGAQWLVKDLLQGFSLLLEDQIRQGEVVEIAGKSGVVEAVTLRYVRLRDLEGTVIFVPSGEITVVRNMTREFAFALLEVGVAYEADTERALEVVGQVFAVVREDEAWRARLPEPAEILGVEELASSSVKLRARIKVVPAGDRWVLRRELHKRLKRAFDEAGIEIPFPQLSVHVRGATDRTASTPGPGET